MNSSQTEKHSVWRQHDRTHAHLLTSLRSKQKARDSVQSGVL